MELLLPRTDAGVAVQALIGAVVFGLALAVVRRREVRVLVVGLGLMGVALMGVRALH